MNLERIAALEKMSTAELLKLLAGIIPYTEGNGSLQDAFVEITHVLNARFTQ